MDTTTSVVNESGQLSLSVPCKINTHLGVYHGRNERGRHQVDSVMVPVALFDTITVEVAETFEVCHIPALDIESHESTVWKAATLLADAFEIEPRVRISVQAGIPEKAGLGGSSADAGAALQLLIQLWKIESTDPRVGEVARQVGADVSFFLDPSPSLFLGEGDVRERTFPSIEMPLVLVMPTGDGISTSEAYDVFDEFDTSPDSFEAACAALEAGDAPAVAANLYNNLAPAACALNPEIDSIVSWLRKQKGVMGAQVSGSGSCSFGICDTAVSAERIACAAIDLGWSAWATHTVC